MSGGEGGGAAGGGDDDGASDGRTSKERLAERRGLDEQVYDPAEDSRLLADAAVAELDGGERALEVGVGSGYVAERVAAEAEATVYGSDLNPHACRQAHERGVETVRADLVEPFADDAFDAVLFNPPYLPTPEELAWDDWTEQALSGGEDGRAVVAPFVESVGRVLAPDGVVLLVVSSLTDIEAVEALAFDVGLAAEEAAAEKHPYERLVVLRLEPVW